MSTRNPFPLQVSSRLDDFFLLDPEADDELDAIGRQGRWEPYPKVVVHEYRAAEGRCPRCDKERTGNGLCETCRDTDAAHAKAMHSANLVEAAKQRKKRKRYEPVPQRKLESAANRLFNVRSCIEEVEYWLAHWKARPVSPYQMSQVDDYERELRYHQRDLQWQESQLKEWTA